MTAADHKLNRNQERKCHLGKDQPDCQKQDRGGDYSNLFSTGRSQLESCAQFWTLHLKENIRTVERIYKKSIQIGCLEEWLKGLTLFTQGVMEVHVTAIFR